MDQAGTPQQTPLKESHQNNVWQTPQPVRLFNHPMNSPFTQFCNDLSPLIATATSPTRSFSMNNMSPKQLFATSPVAEEKGSFNQPKVKRAVHKINFKNPPQEYFVLPQSNIPIKINLANTEEQHTKPINRPKKRVKETDDQKRMTCNCQRSKCLKLYCDCFAAGEYCNNCNCLNCLNTSDNEEKRREAICQTLERNPQAFRPKVEDSGHNKGCHCKRSNCLKKYCECFQSHVKCSDLCKCVGCHNKQEKKKPRGKRN